MSSFHISDDSSEGENRIAVDYAVISRRSRDRAGLRYQRRGVDDEANVANFVESETLMRVEVCPAKNFVVYDNKTVVRETRCRMFLHTYKFAAQVFISTLTDERT